MINTSDNIVNVFGRFNFDTRKAFNNAINTALDHASYDVIIELSKTTYIDSSALGLLLLAKDKCSVLNKSISISGAKDVVLKVLKIANFDKLFKIT